MSVLKSLFQDKSVLLVVTYASAGLGHLRVADALVDGLPTGIEPVLMRADEHYTEWIHRAFSKIDMLRTVMEWLQSGIQEDIVAQIYRWQLRFTSVPLLKKVEVMLNAHSSTPKNIVFVCTHYALAHQLSVIKEKISQRYGIRVFLIVQVTDDSPQRMWYVPGADIIFTPSDKTTKMLGTFKQSTDSHSPECITSPYPISPSFRLELPDLGVERMRQLSPKAIEDTIVSVPISGAAVGLPFVSEVIRHLIGLSRRYTVHVTVKQSSFTQLFFYTMQHTPHVTVHHAQYDRGVVNIYESLYKENIIGLEITKPSEQAFKSLCKPSERGGAILFFSTPVGRQEHDNLDFLERHYLLPSAKLQFELWTLAASGGIFPHAYIAQAERWRGLRLPHGSTQSAVFIHWCMTSGLLAYMANCRVRPAAPDLHKHELTSDGVELFWERLSEFISTELVATS